jgi:hypothetical protein
MALCVIAGLLRVVGTCEGWKKVGRRGVGVDVERRSDSVRRDQRIRSRRGEGVVEGNAGTAFGTIKASR